MVVVDGEAVLELGGVGGAGENKADTPLFLTKPLTTGL